MVASAKRSPRFIKAKSEDELQRLILRMQILTGREYMFLNIYPVKGGVVGWFYAEADLFEKAGALSANS
jgi:hypothetical protein